MSVANIVVAYVNPPKEGAKKGSIKTESGEYYGVWSDKLHQFAKGGKYTVEYTTESYQGKEYKSIKRVIQSAPQAGGGGGENTKAVEMAVMGIVRGAYEGTGGLPDEETIFSQMLAVRAAWTRCFATPLGPSGPKDVPPTNELNDEIPF